MKILNNILEAIGNTPIVKLNKIGSNLDCNLFVKCEFFNSGGSIKDRIVRNMLRQAEDRGEIEPGDTLVEATSGSTGIALALAAARSGYRAILVLPDHVSTEMRNIMSAFGAELMSMTGLSGMERARDLAKELEHQGVGRVLDQFSNTDNPQAHYQGTGPEIFRQTQGEISHFISSMGTTGTIMGVAQFFSEVKPDVEIIGLQPMEGQAIPGIRRWPEAYLPSIFDSEAVDRVIDINQGEAEDTMRRLARDEGIFAGVSSGGAIAAALQVNREVENATIVAIVCDRGDRYLSTGVYEDPVV